ncbi:uncharacterized protein BJ171DRAFT_601649 [Polychytrium aggregatum]|uniref:uncharacterized protein n=1 Tax=Polychytrium aggregatum TaxID=110093 RepID=UPI0022FE018A|nr:uncharacterized protein BJ171DRAFT_601649 [Polychytrium aggregatum]KAI9199734.1 hypothetical protein BJ171DRAFT_601649 [Polychytrium aggregatum]
MQPSSLLKSAFLLSMLSQGALSASIHAGGVNLTMTYPDYGVPPLRPEWNKYLGTFKADHTPDIIQCLRSGEWGQTFDDGPGAPTNQLLDYLQQQNITVTFFIIGANAVAAPNTVKRAFDLGHQIAIHTWSHPHIPTLTEAGIVAELLWTAQVLTDIIGVTPVYMRPPYGEIDAKSRNVIRGLGFIPVIWSNDSSDWDDTVSVESVKSEVDRWASDTSRPPAIGLEHDLNDREAQLARYIIPKLMSGGYKLKPVAECLDDPLPYRRGLDPTAERVGRSAAIAPSSSSALPSTTSAAASISASGTTMPTATPAAQGVRVSSSTRTQVGLSLAFLVAGLAFLAQF